MRTLVFARESLAAFADLPMHGVTDRLAPMLDTIGERVFSDVRVETPDSARGGELSALARGLESALVAALRKRGRLDPKALDRLHACLVPDEGQSMPVALSRAILATGRVGRSSPWPGGIPRLRLGRDAPSRSALKIEEAWFTLLDEDERERWLKPGMTAVDLGAAPGGWTWQLARRSLRVTAVDNGPLAPNVMAMPVVTHLREDGFRYRPKKPVDWLVCDMVEQPVRVASLVASWLRDRHCRFALFNLKLPMKKRYAEVQRCLQVLHEESGLALDVRAKQLYHDREEITVFARSRERT